MVFKLKEQGELFNLFHIDLLPLIPLKKSDKNGIFLHDIGTSFGFSTYFAIIYVNKYTKGAVSRIERITLSTQMIR